MTAQIPDTLRYKDEMYRMIGIKGEGLPTPLDFGMFPAMWHTACYRGYFAGYLCVDQGLFLDELTIGRLQEGSEWVPLNGVEPETQYLTGYTIKDGVKQEITRENGRKYENLKLETYFSGGILIGTGFIQALYVHMGFGKPYQFEQVHELLFHEGTLTQEIHHSEKAAAWRKRIVQQQEDDRKAAEKLRKTGLSEKEIAAKLYGERPSPEEMMKGIEWRFSLDYDNWF